MHSPFVNDMFAIVLMAFQKLYPDKKCQCQWVPELQGDEEKEVYGETCFCDDGSVYVSISAQLPVKDAVETFAHELAHVAAGEGADHGTEWEMAFDAIFEEYNKIGYELFDWHEAVKVHDGKDCIGHEMQVGYTDGEAPAD